MNSLRSLAKSKTFVIGDIHGAHFPLVQCLDRCGFRRGIDKLITLGDICDGWPYVYECVEILLSIPEVDRIDVIGNHDEWLHRWLKTGNHPDHWRQGGMGTLASYQRHSKYKNVETDQWEHDENGEPIRRIRGFNEDFMPETHRRFFEQQMLYYKDDANRLFVHGGFIRAMTLRENQQRPHDDYYFYWNRDLWDEALSASDDEPLKFVEEFSEIFIGHTEITHWTRFKKAPNSYVLIPNARSECPPMHADIIWNIDTGAGSTGRLTIMDIDTHEYWQSDSVNDIYGEYKPNRR